MISIIMCVAQMLYSLVNGPVDLAQEITNGSLTIPLSKHVCAGILMSVMEWNGRLGEREGGGKTSSLHSYSESISPSVVTLLYLVCVFVLKCIVRGIVGSFIHLFILFLCVCVYIFRLVLLIKGAMPSAATLWETVQHPTTLTMTQSTSRGQ